jgi:hypothetical protein
MLDVNEVTLLSTNNRMSGNEAISCCAREIPQMYGNPVTAPKYFKEDSMVAVLEYNNYHYVVTPLNIATLHLLKKRVKMKTIKESFTNHILTRRELYGTDLNIIDNIFTVELYYANDDRLYDELCNRFSENKQLFIEVLTSLEMYEECREVSLMGLNDITYI